MLGCDPFSTNDASARLPIGLIGGPAFAILGTLIFVYRPYNRIGWLCLTLGFAMPVVIAADLYVQCGVRGTIAAPGMGYVAWFLFSYSTFVIIPVNSLLPMLFPTGRFLSPRWRGLAIAGLLVLALGGTGLGLLPDFSRSTGMDRFAVANPWYHAFRAGMMRESGILPLPAWWFSLFYAIFNLGFVYLNLLGVAAAVVRFRRSVGDERLQMKWLAYFLATAIAIQMLIFQIPGVFFDPQIAGANPWYLETLWFDLVLWAIYLGFPIVIGIAIFKYRLYAIDLIINRTLVYAGLTLIVVLLYTLIVVGSSRLFQNLGSLPGSLAATGLIAVIFHPVRERLQRTVNRLMFGQRDEPYAVLSHLSQQLQTTAVPAETLTSIVQTIAATLKLPYAAIELVEQEVQVGQATVGEPLGEVVELPLRYQNERVGRLLVSPRSPGEHFTPQEEQLLADIAAQTGPVASATRLTLALQRSREQLVLAREEERRRIRRDLHDGLGPTLASQTLKLDTVLELLNGESAAAVAHVTQLKSQTQQMVADIRRLVYELRPPALDELGLLKALRAHVAQMSATNGILQIAIDAAPDPLPPLPAAIEVAAYRIALEAVTNVIRHAQAHTCQVRFVITEDQSPATLRLTITDDGSGLPANHRVGVGLLSMRERAAELGGTCTVGANPNGGTHISVALSFQLSPRARGTG